MKDFPRRTIAGKILCDKAFNIAKNPKYDRYQCRLALVVHKFFGVKTSGRAVKQTVAFSWYVRIK